MKIVDYHVHSCNSFDGKASIHDICESSVKLGIYEICFTEHFSVDPKDVSFNILDYDKYSRDIDKSKVAFKDRLNIRKGLEIGEPYLFKDSLEEKLRNIKLDFIIGSVHNLNSLKLRLYIRNKEKKRIYRDYFEEIYRMVCNSDIDIIGHLDLMKRYAYHDFGNYCFYDYREIIESILREAIDRGIGIEINTSGFRNEVKEPYPSFDVIRLYKELGGEIITIGSDSHDCYNIGNNYFTALDMLKMLNFKYIFRFNNRKPKSIKIE